jgi:hypothetical protein
MACERKSLGSHKPQVFSSLDLAGSGLLAFQGLSRGGCISCPRLGRARVNALNCPVRGAASNLRKQVERKLRYCKRRTDSPNTSQLLRS